MVDKESITITDVLNNALSSDKTIRESAQNNLQQLAINNFTEFLYNLSNELSDEAKPVKIRQIAAVYLKNSILNSDLLRDIWINKIDLNAKNQIKSIILSTLATSYKEVRKAAGIVIAGICRVDLPLNEKWPELITSLCESAYNENVNIKLAAIESLGYICEEISLKTIDAISVDSILSALIQNFSAGIELARSSLKAFFHTIKLAEKNFSKQSELQIIMESIFTAGNTYGMDDDILEKIAQIFIEMASTSNYYDYIAEYLQKIAEFTFYILKNKSGQEFERLTLLALEFWCSLGDEEIVRYKALYNYNMSQFTVQGSSLVNVTNPNSTQLQPTCRKYFSIYYPQLIEIILQFISQEDDDTDSNNSNKEWSVSKASLYILSILSQVIDSEKMDKIINYIDTNIQVEDNIKLKNISILLFSGCSNSLQHRAKLCELVSKHLNRLMKLLYHENYLIKKSTSLLLIKITKHYGNSGVFDPYTLNSCIPLMINTFGSLQNKFVINIIQSLINITRAIGDLDTNRSTNLMSPFFEKLFSELIVTAYGPGSYNKDANLTMYCFLLINELVEYSSHDKQEKLSEILIYFLTQFEGTLNLENTTFNLMCSPGSSDIIPQLQSYYCTIFRVVFKKLFKRINVEMASKIFVLLENSFKLRQTVYEEAVLALGSLASNMGEPFEEIMFKFQDFLVYSLQKYNESSLCKSGIIALGHIVRAIKFNFYKFSDKFIPILIEILTNEEVTRTNKTIAISTLGEICMTINEHFLKYLEPVMGVLFSAAQLATTMSQSDDEDTEEFLKDLRFELIESFTCISFGLDDCGKKDLFVPFVPHIFNFFKTIVGDNFSQRADILKSMLAFVTDMANTYGKEIASICDREFVRQIIIKLRNFKIKKYETEIAQQEQVNIY